MASFMQYQLENGNTIWVEIEDIPRRGMKDVSNDSMDNVIKDATRKFEQAFESVRASATVLLDQLVPLSADEITVTFGLKAAGEASVFAIGKVGADANYAVTIKWNKKDQGVKQ